MYNNNLYTKSNGQKKQQFIEIFIFYTTREVIVVESLHLQTGQLSAPSDTPASHGYTHLIGGHILGEGVVVIGKVVGRVVVTGIVVTGVVVTSWIGVGGVIVGTSCVVVCFVEAVI